MACGLPVITSTRCGAGELVTAHRAGIVCGARDIAAIGNAMQAFLQPSVRAPAAAGALRAVATLTPDAMAARLIELYKAMLERRDPR